MNIYNKCAVEDCETKLSEGSPAYCPDHNELNQKIIGDVYNEDAEGNATPIAPEAPTLTPNQQAERIVRNQLHAFRSMARSMDEHHQTVGIAMTLLTVMPRLEAILDSQRQIIELLTPKAAPAPEDPKLVLPATGLIR